MPMNNANLYSCMLGLKTELPRAPCWHARVCYAPHTHEQARAAKRRHSVDTGAAQSTLSTHQRQTVIADGHIICSSVQTNGTRPLLAPCSEPHIIMMHVHVLRWRHPQSCSHRVALVIAIIPPLLWEAASGTGRATRGVVPPDDERAIRHRSLVLVTLTPTECLGSRRSIASVLFRHSHPL